MKKKFKSLLAVIIAMTCVFTMVCCSAVSGMAASVQLPKAVQWKDSMDSGSSTYSFENGYLYILGNAWIDAELYPFFISDNAKGQNIALMQYGSTYPKIDIFAALPSSTLLKVLHPSGIVASTNGDYAVLIPTYQSGKLTSVYYCEMSKDQVSSDSDKVIGQYQVDYSYDKSGNLTRAAIKDWDFNDFPGCEGRDNKFTYKSGKISTASGIDDGGQFTTSSPTFDSNGRIKTYKTKADTQGDGGIKATISISYNNGKPTSVKINSSNIKAYNDTINFTYSNTNLTKITSKGSNNFTYTYTY